MESKMVYQELLSKLNKAYQSDSVHHELIGECMTAITELEAMLNGEALLRQRARSQVNALLDAIDRIKDLPSDHYIYFIADKVNSKIT